MTINYVNLQIYDDNFICMEGTINFKDYWRYNSSINLARLSVCEDPCCLPRSREQVAGPGISSSG